MGSRTLLDEAQDLRERYYLSCGLGEATYWPLLQACSLIQHPWNLSILWASQGARPLTVERCTLCDDSHPVVRWALSKLCEAEAKGVLDPHDINGEIRVRGGGFLRLAVDDFPVWANLRGGGYDGLPLEALIPKWLQDLADPPRATSAQEAERKPDGPKRIGKPSPPPLTPNEQKVLDQIPERPKGIMGKAISDATGIDEGVVRHTIKALRKAGYKIPNRQRVGYYRDPA